MSDPPLDASSARQASRTSERTSPAASAPSSDRTSLDETLRRERAGRWWRRAVVLVFVAAAALGGVWLYGRLNQPEPPPRWKTEPVERGDVHTTVTATGRLEPLRTVEVGPEISGRVVEVGAEPNDAVTEGQVLVRLDDEPLRVRVDQARAQLAASRAAVKQAAATLTEAQLAEKRSKQLRAQQVHSAAELEVAQAVRGRAHAALAGAKAQTQLAEAQLRSAETDLDRAIIRSPANGVVLLRNVEPGNAVAASLQTPVLFTIAEDLTQLLLRLAVDEADVSKVEAGMKVEFTVDAYGARRFEGRVRTVHLAPTVEGNVVTYRVDVEVSNPELALRPGMTATAQVRSSTAAGVLKVPNAALRFVPPVARQEEPGSANPFIPMRRSGGSAKVGEGAGKGAAGRVHLLRDGELVPLVVQPGATDGKFTEIIGEGLSEGMMVVVGRDSGDTRAAGAQGGPGARPGGKGGKAGGPPQ